ncbi:hypothetical protein I6N95_22845 [Vagococcus sp. BWB3-3]|uniref:Uncharacterized protein n=1 Tax=Vagococcus allomyrinae TaxID=2794353 RepID=A0A940SXZ5_9ENTE|nr:hypothetical protein [Vagococcus allomyrinae]MBP1043871.1 hypothetical protein [Vagococcus allomyrinae]
MTQIKISAAEWLKAETFLNDRLPILFGVCGALVLGVIFLFLYMKKSRKKWQMIGLGIGLAVLIGSFTYIKVRGLAEFNDISTNQSIGIRDRRKKPFSYDYFKKTNATEIDLAKLDNLYFYDRSEVVDQDSITFLGKTDHIYYLKVYNKLYHLNLNSENIEFRGADKPKRTGYRYTLNDKAFQELGFYPEVGPIYTKIIIPKELAELTYQDLDERSEQLTF